MKVSEASNEIFIFHFLHFQRFYSHVQTFEAHQRHQIVAEAQESSEMFTTVLADNYSRVKNFQFDL